MGLLLTTICLLGIGFIMVFSASYYDTVSENIYYYLQRQAILTGLALAILIGGINIPYSWLRRFRSIDKQILLVTGVLLAAVFALPEKSDAHRWIPLAFGFNLQPSEVAKFTVVFYLASLFSRRRSGINTLSGDLGKALLVVGVAAGMIAFEPDTGTAFVLAAAAIAVLLAAGLRWVYLFLAGGAGVIAGVCLILRSPYRLDRVLGFLDPWQDPVGNGFQIIHSLYALGTGGLLGAGISNSSQKLILPAQNTDFIFSVIGEELGFIGAGFVVILFLIFTWRGYLIALRCPDKFGRLLAVGLTTSISLQAAVNIAVVTQSMPTTGITLPFISYGGSSLLMSVVSVGALLSISRYRPAADKPSHGAAAKPPQGKTGGKAWASD
jgi:cell division protein FtsW